MPRLTLILAVLAAVVAGAAFVLYPRQPDLTPCDERTYERSRIASVRDLEAPEQPDLTQASSITADAPASAAWDIIEHFETVWPASNPEHVQTCVTEGSEIVREDMVYHDVEQVDGLTAVMYAHVYDVDAPNRFRWKAEAVYRIGLLRLPIEEGGTFTITPSGQGEVEIRHALWARFPDSAWGSFMLWLSRNALNIEAGMAEHNETELIWFRDQAEADAEG